MAFLAKLFSPQRVGNRLTAEIVDRNLDRIKQSIAEIAREYREHYAFGLANYSRMVANYRAARRVAGVAGMSILVAGRTTARDGGEGTFVWRTGSATDNDGTILVGPTGSGGYWERKIETVTRASWFGSLDATGVSDCTGPINLALASGAGEVYLGEGTFLCNSADVSIPSYTTLVGAGRNKTIVKVDAGFSVKTTSTIKAGLRDLEVWNAGSAAAALQLIVNPNTYLLHFDAVGCDFRNTGNSTGACVLTQSNTGAGGNGFCYWPSFDQCNFEGAHAPGSALIRTTGAANGTIFLKVFGGRMTGAERHFDLARCANARTFGISHDANAFGTGNGRFIYLGDFANQNEFLACHFEESGMDEAVEFTALCDQNRVHDATSIDLSHVIGSGLGVANSTSGFTQDTVTGSNINQDPTTFPLLLQDVIQEKTSGAGVEVDGLTIKDGAILGSVHTASDVPAFVPGASFHALHRPDGSGIQAVVLDGVFYTHSEFRLYNATGAVTGLAAFSDSFVNTTDATPTNLASYTFADNSGACVDFTVCAYRTGGARGTGAVGDFAKFVRRVSAKRVSGTTTIVATETVGTDQLDADLTAAGIAVGAVVSGSAVVLQVTGAASTNLRWCGLRESKSIVTA